MRELSPWKTGAALALTIAVGYSICAAIFAAWPGAAMQFLSAMFHGLDFSKLETTTSWSFVAFACVLGVFVIWGFVMGTLFAWFHNRLGGKSSNG